MRIFGYEITRGPEYDDLLEERSNLEADISILRKASDVSRSDLSYLHDRLQEKQSIIDSTTQEITRRRVDLASARQRESLAISDKRDIQEENVGLHSRIAALEAALSTSTNAQILLLAERDGLASQLQEIVAGQKLLSGPFDSKLLKGFGEDVASIPMSGVVASAVAVATPLAPAKAAVTKKTKPTYKRARKDFPGAIP